MLDEAFTQADYHEARMLFAEQTRRRVIWQKARKMSYGPQWKFINDDSKLKAALTTRRSGKSSGAALDLLLKGEFNPGVSMLYTGLTDTSAHRILWKDCIKPFAKELGIGVKFRRSENEIEFSNGTMLYLLGVDNKIEEIDKVLGQKLLQVYIDEGAKYRLDIEPMINEVLMPAVMDYDGQISMIGMPSNNIGSYFYKVTAGAEVGWSVHKWSALQNPYVAKQMRAQIARLRRRYPNLDELPWFRQQYLGEWAVDVSKRPYKFRGDVDIVRELPIGKYLYTLGVDLGYDDPSAFVINAFREGDPHLYVRKVIKKAHMDITACAEMIKTLQRRFNPYKTIVDGAHKQSLKELQKRHKISCVAAEKLGKSDFIRLCSDDLQEGRVKFLAEETEALTEEMRTLSWDEKALAKGNYVEAARAHNHACDAFLYSWRWAWNYLGRGEQATPMTAEDEIDEWWEKEAMKNRANSLNQYGSYEQEIYGGDDGDFYH
jgi:hypothetical protein